jgi:hypothetical protein
MARVLKRGLTLAEVILSVGLCAVALLTVIALAISAQRGMQKSSDTVVAQSYAGDVLEQFLYDLPSPTDSFWSQTQFASPYAQDQAQLGPKTYRAQLFLTPGTGTLAGLLTCSVNVSWDGQAGQGRQSLGISRLVYAP